MAYSLRKKLRYGISYSFCCYLLSSFLFFSLPLWSLRVSSSKMLYISINALALVILSSFGFFFLENVENISVQEVLLDAFGLLWSEDFSLYYVRYIVTF